MSFVPDPSHKRMINERKAVRLKQCDGGRTVQKVSEGRFYWIPLRFDL